MEYGAPSSHRRLVTPLSNPRLVSVSSMVTNSHSLLVPPSVYVFLFLFRSLSFLRYLCYSPVALYIYISFPFLSPLPALLSRYMKPLQFSWVRLCLVAACCCVLLLVSYVVLQILRRREPARAGAYARGFHRFPETPLEAG